MRNSDVRNPLMEWICTLSMGQRVAIIIGLFVLASIPQIIHQMFPKVTFRGPMILGFLFYVVVALNVVGYILISFQVNWKATTRNRAALLFSLISVLLFVIAISAMVCFLATLRIVLSWSWRALLEIEYVLFKYTVTILVSLKDWMRMYMLSGLTIPEEKFF